VRVAAGALDRARGVLGLDEIPVRSPEQNWDGGHPDHPMWESDKQKLRKHQIDRGIVRPDAEEQEAKPAPDKPVKVYFKRGCPSTRAARGLLDEREVDYEAIDVTDDEVQRSWLKLVTGQSTTPQVFIGGESIGGFDALRELDQRGEFMERVEALTQSPESAAPSPKRIKLPILHPERSPFEDLEDGGWADEADSENELEGDALLARVREVLDECRPMVQADGGDITLLDVQSDRVSLELTGNCVGCPSAQATLKQGIERRLRSRIPQIRSISSPQLQ
jgi:Fe-S cluster biogenesis protein NfuA/glutaredoxin